MCRSSETQVSVCARPYRPPFLLVQRHKCRPTGPQKFPPLLPGCPGVWPGASRQAICRIIIQFAALILTPPGSHLAPSPAQPFQPPTDEQRRSDVVDDHDDNDECCLFRFSSFFLFAFWPEFYFSFAFCL